MIEHPFTRVAEGAPTGLLCADSSGRCSFVNARWRQLARWTGDTAPPDWTDVAAEADRAALQAAWRVAVRNGAAFSKRFRVADGAGSTRWLAMQATPFMDEAGEVQGYFGTLGEVTEQHGREERLLRALAGTGVGMWGWDIATGAVTWSDNVATIFAIDPDAFDGTYEVYRGLIYPTDLALLDSALKRALESGEDYRVEHRIVTPSGEIRWLEGAGQVTRDQSGQPVRLDGTVIDITQRKRAERAHRMAQSSIDQAADPVFWTCPNGQILYANARAAIDLGTTADALLGRTIGDVATTIDGEVWNALWRRVQADGAITRETALRRADGTSFPAELRFSALEFEGEALASIFVRDLTERRQAKLDLVESDARLRLALDAAHIGVWTWNISEDIVAWDERMFEMYGVSPSMPMTLAVFLARLDPSDRDRIQTAIDNVIATSGSIDMDYNIVRPDGTVRHILALGAVARDEHGRAVRMDGLCVDATERSAAETALRASEERYRTLVASLAEGIAMYDLSGRLLAHNHAAERILGVTREQIEGRSLSDDGWRMISSEGSHLRPEDYPATRTLRDGVARHDQVLGLFQPGGELTWLSVNTEPMFRDGQEEHYGVVVSFTDITETRTAEQRIRRLNASLEERVRARTAELEIANRELESFASAVSHDLRAPVRAMTGFAQILLNEFGDTLRDEGRHYVDRIVSAGGRMGQLIDDLLVLSRLSRSEIRKQTVDVSELAEHSIAELRRGYPERNVDVTIEPHLQAEADPRLLRVVLDNLLGNAWKFTVDRNPATISLGRSVSDDVAVFCVKDNGAGFDMRYAQKLFGPFQRLHGDHEFEGTGIGLATVQRILERHGGKVWGEGQVDCGATFYFVI